MSTQIRTLAPSMLDKLVREGKPVYVMNTSRTPSGDKGVIVVNFFDGTRREYFKMPPTFIPMAISDVIPGKQLINSRDFKQCLVKGMLTLVDPDQATDYLNTKEAREEYDSLVLSEMSSRTSTHINMEAEAARRANVPGGTGMDAGPQDQPPDMSISSRVMGIVEDFVQKKKTAKAVLQELKRQQGAISVADITYVLANVPDAAIAKWGKEAATTAIHATAPKVTQRVSAEDEYGFDFDSDANEDRAAMTAAAGQQILDGRTSLGRKVPSVRAPRR
jgi:hypothetical protein